MQKLLAGVDEVGRGSLIGPVYAAAVILKEKIDKKKLKDSKKLSRENRKILEKYIKKNSIWAIGSASKIEIEKYNILNASLLAMERTRSVFVMCSPIGRDSPSSPRKPSIWICFLSPSGSLRSCVT